MNKVMRDFMIDIGLFLLLVVELAAVLSMPRGVSGHQASVSWHVHALLGIVLTGGCTLHAVLHWRWMAAVLAGKIKRPVKLIMDSMVSVMLVLAAISGHAAMTSAAAAGQHRVYGSIALLGLVVHGVKHMRWMASVARRLLAEPQPSVQ